ncbi:MAG: PGF-pre-PGF domain-containing protein, partial [Nanoarchaeota archaeon]|nr:PGF-pre-PGF domain-containing protein [Nanoarchaeota archaeon]
TGSIILNSQQNGVSSVSIRYSVPALGTTTAATTTTTSSSLTGGLTTTVYEQSVAIVAIPSGETKTMTFTTSELAVSSIDITAKNSLTNIALKINTLTSLPSTVTASTEVYKYLQFTPTRISESDLEKAVIRFKVTKSWISNNNIDEDKVSLNRWANSKWNELPTTRVAEDSTNYIYEAETPGFSYFVIKGEKVTTVTDDTDTETNETSEGTTSKGTNWWLIVGMLIAALAAVGGVYYYFNFYKTGKYPGYKHK